MSFLYLSWNILDLSSDNNLGVFFFHGNSQQQVYAWKYKQSVFLTILFYRKLGVGSRNKAVHLWDDRVKLQIEVQDQFWKVVHEHINKPSRTRLFSEIVSGLFARKDDQPAKRILARTQNTEYGDSQSVHWRIMQKWALFYIISMELYIILISPEKPLVFSKPLFLWDQALSQNKTKEDSRLWIKI